MRSGRFFVCTANSARSDLAAALWRRASDIPAISAGTDPADEINPEAFDAAYDEIESRVSVLASRLDS